MATQTNIYLTEEVGTFAKNNPNSDIGSLLAFSASQTIELVVAALILSGLFYFGMKTLAAANIGTQGESKKMLQKIAGAFILLVIVLAVFSSQGALTFDFSLKPLSSSPGTQPGLTNTSVATENDGGGAAVVTGDEASMFQAIQANESAARAELNRNGIDINTGPCAAVRSSNCTSVGGLGPRTITTLTSLMNACACTITITGGTEWWLHGPTTKHRPGSASAVDIRKNPLLDNFIYRSTEFKKGTSWNICIALFTWNGYVFCDEASKSAQTAHWHIQPL